MKNSNVLGYLAAFTLGVICAAVIFYVAQRPQRIAPPGELPSPPPPVEVDEEPVSPPPRKQTFQRMIRPPVPAPPPIETPREEPIDGPPAEPEQVAVIGVPEVREVQRVITVPVGHGSLTGRAEQGGRISGKVRFVGEPPPEKRISLDPTCGAKWEKAGMRPQTRFYILGKDHGLADVTVSLVLEPQKTRRYGTLGVPLKIAERNCWFDPYVSAMQAGQSLIVENRDSVLHHLRMNSDNNGEFNRALLPGRDVRFEVKHPEESLRFKCDVHPWEFAYVAVYDHPFFTVSDRNGVFVIPDVPPGQYTLEARHRKAGTLRKEITLEPHRNVDVQFDFNPTSPQTAQREESFPR